MDLLSDENELVVEYELEINMEENYTLSISTINDFTLKI